jgi:splicing factor 1
MNQLYIPYKDYPDYNFIGLIIGPRGNTQKQMEREFGCKIAIRGKGSVKEGKGRRDGVVDPDSHDDIHVLVQGDNQDSVDRAATEVERLLTPIDESENEHKRTQLRELAALNGTLRNDNFWHRGGGEPLSQAAKNVLCAWCGDRSHPTSDCPRKAAGEGPSIGGMGGTAGPASAAMDNEYMDFMNQLSNKPGSAAPPGAAAAAPEANVADANGAAPHSAGGAGMPPPNQADGAPPPAGSNMPGASATPASNDADFVHLFIGFMPNHADDAYLFNLFR